MEVNTLESRINVMFDYPKKVLIFPIWKSSWYLSGLRTSLTLFFKNLRENREFSVSDVLSPDRYQLSWPIIMFLVAHLASGCVSPPPKQLDETSKFGISLEKPKNWSLETNERNGSIVLEVKNEGVNTDSARIEIVGNACVPTPSWFKGLDEEIELNIDRIGNLYNLDSVTRLQEPIVVETGNYEVAKAIIAIPTISMLGDPVRNKVGGQDPNVLQTIELFAIKNSNTNFVMAYIYKGNSEEFNAEAEKIVDSIQLTCSVEP